MINKVTLDQAEQMVAQLPPEEQLKLVARIGERLSESILLQTDDERRRRQYAARVEAFLKMSEEMAAETVGEVDSAEDVRRIREERASRL